MKKRKDIPALLEAVDKRLQQDVTDIEERVAVVELKNILGELYMRPFTPIENREPLDAYVAKVSQMLSLNPHEVKASLIHLQTMMQTKTGAKEKFLVTTCLDALTSYLQNRPN